MIILADLQLVPQMRTNIPAHVKLGMSIWVSIDINLPKLRNQIFIICSHYYLQLHQ